MSIQKDLSLHKVPKLTDDLLVFSFANITYVYNLTALRWVRLAQRIAPDGLWFGTTNPDYTERNARIEKLRTEKFEERELSSLIIIPTWQCPGTCKYCYAKNHGSKENLTIGKILKTLDDRQITPDSIKSTIIIGGEPLTNWMVTRFVVDFFYKAEHTICTGLEVDEEVLENLVSFGHPRDNFELSISLDPPNSPRYNETNTYERNVKWINRFASAGIKVRAKATIHPTASDLSRMRMDIPGVRIDADGVAYGNLPLDQVTDFSETLRVFEEELVKVITGEIPLSDSFCFFGPSVQTIVENPDSHVPKNCGCGFSYYTIDSTGKLTFCDSPGKPEVDGDLDSPALRKQVIPVRAVCSDCSLLPVCGGTCEVEGEKQFFCFVHMLKFACSMFALFVNAERARNV